MASDEEPLLLPPLPLLGSAGAARSADEEDEEDEEEAAVEVAAALREGDPT